MAPTELSRRRVPFGGHQFAEYVLAAALIGVGIHSGGRPALVLVVGGAAIGVLPLVSKGRLALVHLVPKRLHLILDLVLAVCFAFSPLLYLHNLQVIPIILSEAVAVLLVRMSLTTMHSAVPAVAAVPAPVEAPPSATPTGFDMPLSDTPAGARTTAGAGTTAGGTTAASGVPAAAASAAMAGRLVGTALAKARDSGAPLAAARGLGRVTGHARRLGRAARASRSSPDRPQP